jgi:similar to stage IV sporulation protein
MPEKFLNKALDGGARIYSARRIDRRTLVLVLDSRSASLVRAMAERFSLKCDTRRIAGLQNLVDYLRLRPTVLAAFGVLMACLALFLSRIWIVEVRDLGGGIPEQAQAALEKAGVRTGAAAAAIDLPLLALELSALEGVSYASAAREGVALVVEIAGEDAAPELYDISRARDLVAACDGIISGVNVKSGTAMVKPGDTVRRGQVLISGEERITNEETHPVGALGSVTARIWCEGSAEGPVTCSVKDYTGRASASTQLSLFDLSIPLTRADSYGAWDEETELIPVGGLFLPLNIRRTTYREYVPRTVELDRAALEASLTQAAIASAEAKMAENAPENADIIDKWTDFSMIDTDTLRARAVIEYTADIAVTRQYLEDN